MTPRPLFSVVVPTLGSETKLLPFLAALERQTLPHEQFELVVVFDGSDPTPKVAERLGELHGRGIRMPERSGPPAARNRGAEAASGEYLAWTEDDVIPEPDWLERAAARLQSDPTIDVIEGRTVKPGGKSVRIRGEEGGQYILCNLIVRRSMFLRVGGCHPGYYEGRAGIFFREDTDLGWSLEAARARVVRDTSVVVMHPMEHPRPLDPLRWARRYEMDPLLMARYPDRFRERIEVHRLGPFRIRRPFVRACYAFTIACLAALVAVLAGEGGLAALFGFVAALTFLPIWGKWRFSPLRLPVVLLVPFVLVASHLRGRLRLRESLRPRPDANAA